MQFAAAFIEYLVTGCCAFLWLVPLFGHSIAAKGALEKAEVALLLPVTYVLGMLLDLLSERLVSPVKRRIKKDARERQSELKIASSTAFLAWHSPELMREFQTRSSRDRIARGAMLNTLLLTIVACFKPGTPGLLGIDLSPFGAVVVFGAICILCFVLWMRCEWLSTSFKQNAIETIQKFPKEKR